LPGRNGVPRHCGSTIRFGGPVCSPARVGRFQYRLTGQDGYRVWLDGAVVTEDWNLHEPATALTKKIHLDKDHAYAIKIEYFQNVGNSEARLLWSLPSQIGQDALDAAGKADLVVMVAGLSPRIEGEEMKVDADGFSGGDRTSLDLPAPQEQLLQRIHGLGKPTVLILMNGSAVAINWADENLPAIVEAWYPGEEGGNAVAELLRETSAPQAVCR